ncbi:MAG TPA: hypothetical protein VIY08_10435 [Candidatus Nitrosocosmicus sp.]
MRSLLSESSPIIIFEGTPSELLSKLNQVATRDNIDTYQRGWPKDGKWLVKRINIIKTNLQNGLGIRISIDRNTKNNTSIIKIEKNNSGNSGEHKLSPENESLSPVSNSLSPEDNDDLSTKSNNSGDTRDIGDKSDVIMEEEDKSNDEIKENSDSKTDILIGYGAPYYYCREHLDVENVHKEEIERHILYSKVHKSP